MRACARVALASIALSARFSLSGCAAIEELKETFLRWVESQKLPSGRGVSADELPEATPVVPPEKTPKEPSKRHPQPKDAARKLQRQTVVLPPKKPPIPDSTEAVRHPARPWITAAGREYTAFAFDVDIVKVGRGWGDEVNALNASAHRGMHRRGHRV